MGIGGTREKDRFSGLDAAIWVVVLVLAFSRFIHLGYGDLKDWDECLYAWRAKIIVFQGAWLDQSDLAWGGFYSAAFPPLQVWVTAVLFHLFGFNEFSARFWSALMGAGTVIVLFLMGRRLGRCRWTGFFAALFMSSIWYFTVYSRRAQFDVPYTFCIAASLYGYIAYLDRLRITGVRDVAFQGGGSDRTAWAWLVFSGAMLGMGLMTKIALALMAPIIAGTLALYMWLRGRYSFRRIIIEQTTINGVAFLINLPWHLAMTVSGKGVEFWEWYVGRHLLGRSMGAAFDAHIGSPWFYIGEIWEELPAPVLALTFLALDFFIAVLVASFWMKGVAKDPEGIGEDTDVPDRPLSYRDTRYLLPLLWLGFQFALFSVSSTKRETYTIPMYPPIALMAAMFLGEQLSRKRLLDLSAITLFATVTLCILSRMKNLDDSLVAAVKNLDVLWMYGDVFLDLLPLVAGVGATTIALYVCLVKLGRWPTGFRRLALAVTVVATTAFCLRDARDVLDRDKATRRFGWQQVRPYIDSMDFDYLVFAGAYQHPAARYYLNGLQLEWHDTVRLVTAPKYEEAQLPESFASSGTVRVLIMKSEFYNDENWTEEQRRWLLGKLELLAEGEDLAIYDVARGQ